MKMFARFDSKIPNQVDIQIEEKEGEMTRKKIRLSDFISLISNSSERKDSFVDIGLLPQGYYHGAVSNLYDNTFNCTVVLPEDRRPILFGNDMYIVQFPPLVFNFGVYKEKLNTSKCFALVDKVSDGAMLYHYPFGNVNHSGEICWGTIHLPKIQCMKDVDQLIRLFFESETNNDLFVSDKQKLWEMPFLQNQRAFLEYLKTANGFPYEALSSTGMTLKKLIRNNK